MKVELEAINQRVTLLRSTPGDIITFTATLRLPNGSIVDVQMATQDAEKILKMALSSAGEEKQELPDEPEGQPELFNWEGLSDAIIPDAIKQVMRDMNVDSQLPGEVIDELVADISERMGGNIPDDDFVDEEREEFEPAPPQQPAPKARLVRPTERVSTERVPVRRTVQMNSQGYPIMPELYQGDPGEIGPGADEDGVGQL
jgi:hypothetical protein